MAHTPTPPAKPAPAAAPKAPAPQPPAQPKRKATGVPFVDFVIERLSTLTVDPKYADQVKALVEFFESASHLTDRQSVVDFLERAAHAVVDERPAWGRSLSTALAKVVSRPERFDNATHLDLDKELNELFADRLAVHAAKRPK